jgi:uridine kinase
MRSLVIGLAGGTGSGKTSVTRSILRSLDSSHVLVVQHDSYYKDISSYGDLSPDQINFDHPASLETDLLVRHIEQLCAGNPVDQPVYDFKTHRRLTQTKRVEPKEVILIEGILIFVDKAMRDLMDIKIFVDTDADERVLRRIRRDIRDRGRSLDSVIHQYISTVKPMHLEFVEPSKQWADIIIPRGSDNKVAIDMVVTKIRSLLQSKYLE